MFSKLATSVATVATALASALATASSAHAAFHFTLNETPTGVELIGSGTLNTTALTGAGINGFNPFLNPGNGSVLGGPGASGLQYPLTGGPTFGDFVARAATSGRGDKVGISGAAGSVNPTRLIVPQDYVSGSFLTSSAFWSGQTYASLGAARGVYEWTWGTGPTEDRLTLTVPEPTTLSLLAAASALALRRRAR